MIRILSIREDRLNSIYPYFGTVICNSMEHYKDRSAVVLNQESVNEFMKSADIHPIFKDLTNTLIQYAQFGQYSFIVIVKSN